MLVNCEALTRRFGSTDALVDVSDIADKLGSQFGGWYKDIESYCKPGGAWKAIPFSFYGQVLNYRGDWFKEANIALPKTMDDLIEMARALNKAGHPFGQALGHSFTDPRVRGGLLPGPAAQLLQRHLRFGHRRGGLGAGRERPRVVREGLAGVGLQRGAEEADRRHVGRLLPLRDGGQEERAGGLRRGRGESGRERAGRSG